ncbi:hypothetical protein [Spirosoma aerophilum]
MITSVIFEQVDHPLIIIAQLISSFFLFRLFFAIRKTSQPLPQIVGGLAFGFLANVVARATHESWFWISDIIQYVTLAAVVIAAVRAAHKAKAEVIMRPGAPVVVADVFDRLETKVTWGVGLLLAGVLTYYCVDLYMKLQHTDAQVIVATQKATQQVTAQYNEQLCETKEQQDSLLEAVSSISATQGTIIENQHRNSAAILKGQKNVGQLVSKQNQAVKKTIQSSVIQARPIEPTKPKVEAADEEKQNIWKRFKGMFHSSARRDSLSSSAEVMPSDTVVFQ